MPTALVKGGNVSLVQADMTGPFVVTLTWARKGDLDPDVTALLLADGKVRSDLDMVFHNQPDGPADAHGAVRYLGKGVGGFGVTDRVRIDPAGLPSGVNKVAVSVSLDEGFGALGPFRVDIAPEGTPDIPAVTYTIADATSETAMVAIEVYEHTSGWKARAVGQGWTTGLAGLATDFGIKISDDTAVPAAAPVTETGPAPKIDLAKPPVGTISLAKHQKVSFAKKPGGRITASLKWINPDKDMDLYALYITADGRSGACYWNDLGKVTGEPWIGLIGGDQKTGGSDTIETIEIAHPDRFRHILFCAYSAVANGSGSMRSFGASMQVTDHAGSDVTSPLIYSDPAAYWVAMALVSVDADNVSVQHVERYSGRDVENRPTLYPDGRIVMDTGKIEFK